MTTITPRHSVSQDYRDFCDSICLRLGLPTAEADPHDAGAIALSAGKPKIRHASRRASDLARDPFLDSIEAYLRWTGPQALRDHLSKASRPELAKIAMSRTALSRYYNGIPQRPGVALVTSTGDVPGIVADSLNKGLQAHFALAPRRWRTFCREGSVRDFKPAERTRVTDYAGLIEPKEPGDAITFRAVSESNTETLEAVSYSGGISVTRQLLLNDDLDA